MMADPIFLLQGGGRACNAYAQFDEDEAAPVG
jgi:hypothetical protein